MKPPSGRATFLLSALVAALLWTTGVAGQPGRGLYLTRNGFRAPLYGVSQTHHAEGNATTACAALDAVQVDAARIGVRVSRSMLANSPQAIVGGPAGGATFDVRYTDAQGTGFLATSNGATRRRAFEAALTAWSKVLYADQPIRVEATMHEMDDGDDDPDTSLLATAGPTDFWLIDDTIAPSALLWQMIGGRYENAGDSDISVNVNDQIDWDYRLDGGSAPGKSSLMYTLMHELAHGLGMIDSFDSETGALSNDPVPFVFDVFVNRGFSRRNRIIDHPSAEALRDMVSGALFFNGDSASEASRAHNRPLFMVKLYAPDPYEPGSSVSHVDQVSYEDNRIAPALMTPYLGKGSDTIDRLTLGIMKDLGYALVTNATTRTPQ
ncbi:MAG: hypothetical protein ABI039_13590 [Vicinamibacterales bacterium]